MKFINVIWPGLAALILGACASKPSQQPTVSTTSSTTGSYVVPAK
jgi:outer membrane biogenesis lipoprotein LolB